MKNEIGIQFRYTINWVIQETWRSRRIYPHEPDYPNPHEPDYIANLVIKGTPRFHDIISHYPIIWGSVSTIGIFCHQSPMVSYFDGQRNRQCELGDLLWCHFHINDQGFIIRNALLFQSKLSNDYHLDIPYDDDQLKLYREWPEFEYHRSGTLLNGQVRHLLPPLPHTGAQYMSIDNSRPTNPFLGIYFRFNNNTWPIGVTPVTPILSADTPLETELVRFLFSATGKPFDSYNNRNTDQWTKIVWDLLGNGFRKAFNRRRAGFNNTPRIGGIANADGLLKYLGNTNNIYDAFENDFMNDDFKSLFSEDVGNNTIKESPILDNDDVRSPSIIIFTTNEENSQKNQ